MSGSNPRCAVTTSDPDGVVAKDIVTLLKSNNAMYRMISFAPLHRKGLVDHSQALQLYCSEEGISCKAESSYGRIFAHFWRGSRLFIFWDNSFKSVFCAAILRMIGALVIYYYHEPGGIGQKLVKNDPFFYSLFAALAEFVQKICQLDPRSPNR